MKYATLGEANRDFGRRPDERWVTESEHRVGAKWIAQRLIWEINTSQLFWLIFFAQNFLGWNIFFIMSSFQEQLEGRHIGRFNLNLSFSLKGFKLFFFQNNLGLIQIGLLNNIWRTCDKQQYHLKFYFEPLFHSALL